MRALFLLILCACGPETVLDKEALCAGEGPSSMVLGTGEGGAFEALVDGDVVNVVAMPAGGWGVVVRGRTTGLAPGSVSLHLTTTVDGVAFAGYQVGEADLFCQDDGTGIFTDQGVPLDPWQYEVSDDLIALDGQRVALQIIATDSADRTSVGAVMVVQ